MHFSYTLLTTTPISTSLCCCKTLILKQSILFSLDPAGSYLCQSAIIFSSIKFLITSLYTQYKYRTVYFICKSLIINVYSHIQAHVLSFRFWSSNWIHYSEVLLVHLFCDMTHQNKEKSKEQRCFTKDKSGQLWTKNTKSFKAPRTIISNRST